MTTKQIERALRIAQAMAHGPIAWGGSIAYCYHSAPIDCRCDKCGRDDARGGGSR